MEMLQNIPTMVPLWWWKVNRSAGKYRKHWKYQWNVGLNLWHSLSSSLSSSQLPFFVLIKKDITWHARKNQKHEPAIGLCFNTRRHVGTSKGQLEASAFGLCIRTAKRHTVNHNGKLQGKWMRLHYWQRCSDNIDHMVWPKIEHFLVPRTL